VLDEVIGAAVWLAGYAVVAANMDVNFRLPVPLHQLIQTKGYVVRREGHKVYARGEIFLPDGTLLVEGTGLFIEAPHLFENSKMFREE